MSPVDDIKDGQPTAPAETVKLSSSIAKILVTKTPQHAFQAHRLLGGGKSKSTDATEDGKIYEAFMFGNAAATLEKIPFKDYKKDEAKAARDKAIAAGKTPIKADDYDEMADTAMKMLKGLNDGKMVFEGGEAQVEIVWFSDGVECKGVLDYLILRPDFYIIYDLKCVEDASPDKITRSIVDYGWDIQAAAYTEAVETKYPELAGKGLYRLGCCEKTAPHAVNIVALSGMFMELGRRKWARAKAMWAPCLRDNVWPGYGETTVNPLPWQMKTEEGKEAES